MQVVLFRHGIAQDRETFSGADAERALTDRGEQRTRQAAFGLMFLCPALTAIGASPYLRARQTANLIAEVYRTTGGEPQQNTVEAMQPGGRPAEVCHWLEGHGRDGGVALVGHEPDLSGLMAWLTTGEMNDFTRFKKAGACLIEFSSGPARGRGELQWLMTPAALRRLAG